MLAAAVHVGCAWSPGAADGVIDDAAGPEGGGGVIGAWLVTAVQAATATSSPTAIAVVTREIVERTLVPAFQGRVDHPAHE